jgi:16S rRNA (adenine1518-N6/adenine1519-N6)-dimethyltransferase
LDSPKDILRRRGLRAKHSWGQNFLGDEDILEQIAASLQLQPGEDVVELGPGLGHLTRALLDQGGKVTAVERDRDMVNVLTDIFKPEIAEGRLNVLSANAAETQFAQVAGVPKTALVGNLPYHLTSPILFSVLEQHEGISRAVFTVQKEVADRLAAEPGGREYGLLTVLLGLYFRIHLLLDLPRHHFHPPPNVDSAVIRLTKLLVPRAAVSSDAHYRRVVKASFAQRRKTLLNSLQTDPTLGGKDVIKAALERAQLDGGRRAETLSVEDFAALERALAEVKPS